MSYAASRQRGKREFIHLVQDTWPRWPPCLYMAKNLKKYFFSRTMPWNLVCSIWDSSTTKFILRMTVSWPWPKSSAFFCCYYTLWYGNAVNQPQWLLKVKVVWWPLSSSLWLKILKVLFLRNYKANESLYFIWMMEMREWHYIQMVMVTWPRWLPCPYMVKTLKNLPFSTCNGLPWN